MWSALGIVVAHIRHFSGKRNVCDLEPSHWSLLVSGHMT